MLPRTPRPPFESPPAARHCRRRVEGVWERGRETKDLLSEDRVVFRGRALGDYIVTLSGSSRTSSGGSQSLQRRQRMEAGSRPPCLTVKVSQPSFQHLSFCVCACGCLHVSRAFARVFVFIDDQCIFGCSVHVFVFAGQRKKTAFLYQISYNLMRCGMWKFNGIH